MNDFKTSGCNSSHTGDSPYVWNVDSDGGLCVSDAILKPYNLVLDCKDVTFRLKELDITLVENKTKEYLDNIDAITINGIKFVKPKSEGKSDEAELEIGGADLPTVRMLAHELIDVARKALDALDGAEDGEKGKGEENA